MKYGWDFIKRDNLHDDCGTHHTVPGLSGFGRSVLREHRSKQPQHVTGEQSDLDDLPDDALMTHVDLAKALGLKPEPLRSRLDRWRKKHGEGWQQVTEPKARQPKYLYCARAVRDVLREALLSFQAAK